MTELYRHHRERDAIASLLQLTDIHVYGQENLDTVKTTPAVFVLFPHTSHLDSMLVRYVLPKEMREKLYFLAKESYWGGSKRWLGQLTNDLILLPTEKNAIPKEAMKKARDILDRGCYIGIAPEGTRSDKEIEERPFLPGIDLLIYLTNYQYPIVPVLLHGPAEVWPKGQSLPLPFIYRDYMLERKKISVGIGPALYFSPQEKGAITAYVRGKCIELYRNLTTLETGV